MSARYIRGRALLTAVLASSCIAQVKNERIPVPAEKVSEVIRALGVDVLSLQLQVLSRPVMDPDGSLKVATFAKVDSDTAVAKLGCTRAIQCLPFYVLVHGLKLAEAEVSQAGPARQRLAAKSAIDKTVVARGQPISLLIEDSSSRIVMPAICMEKGRLGQIIRLASLDRKRTFTGEVLSRSLVRGTLPESTNR